MSDKFTLIKRISREEAFAILKAANQDATNERINNWLDAISSNDNDSGLGAIVDDETENEYIFDSQFDYDDHVYNPSEINDFDDEEDDLDDTAD